VGRKGPPLSPTPESNGGGPLIRLDDVRRTFHVGEIDVPALRGVTLSIERGELVALTGASGSGKSTLMNLLGCLDRPTAGEYWLDGQPTSRLSNDGRALIRNKKIGFVFQSFNLLPRTTALEQVMMPLSYTAGWMSDRESKKRARAILDKVGLGERLDHTPGQLSGGQQQRIAIARALVNHPPVLLADEPTGNLDSKTAMEILAMIQVLNRDEGITVVLVTHDPVVASHATRVIHMHDGVVDSDSALAVAAAAPAGGPP
jgi:ABC-type lipoprotein export system ATPase subunit